MLLLENPLLCLYIVIGLIIFFSLLFKLLNKLEEMKVKNKEKSDKKDKKDSGEKKTEPVTEKKENKEEKVLPDLPGDDKNNYLYDRFVVNPTHDDCIRMKSISDTFISEKELEEIRSSKVQIDVSPVEKINCCCNVSKETTDKIENIVNENRSARSKLLQEFDGLSKEMKLLLIENILKK